MQGRVLGDNRLSGRTTRMLAAALASCLNGGYAYVVIPRGLWDHCVTILEDMGATSINKSQHVASFGADTRLYFRILGSDDIRPEYFEVRGIKAERTFWDHEAVRQSYNHIIMKYHEYD